VSTFAYLAVGDSDRSWRFAWLTHTLIVLPLCILIRPDPRWLITAPLFAVASSTLEVFTVATLAFAIARLFGSTLSWELALRACGYSTAWTLPSCFAVVLPPWGGPPVMSWFVANGGRAAALFGLMHKNAGLSRTKAVVVSVLVIIPVLLASSALWSGLFMLR
jgi:hypothetical protein